MGGRGQGGRQGEKGRGRQAGKEGPERSRVTSKLDNKTQTDAILLDFAKAFDKVPHKRLLSKLTAYGITGNTHTFGSHLFYQIVSSESQLMEPCQTSQTLHLVSRRRIHRSLIQFNSIQNSLFSTQHIVHTTMFFIHTTC